MPTVLESVLPAPNLLTQGAVSRRGGRFLRHPLVRLLLLPVTLAPVAAVNYGVSVSLLDRLPAPLARHQIVFQSILLVSLLMLVYRWFCQKVEGRTVMEFSTRGAAREFLLGAGLSILWVLVYVGGLAAMGGYRVQAIQGFGVLLDGFFFFGMGAFAQELFFTLIVLRLLEDWLGSRTALPLALGVFLAAHAMNPNHNLLSTLGLLTGGASFMGAFLVTRRFWMVWGLHFAWNFMQAGVFGMPNSGHTFQGFLKPTIQGPVWLTGGAFGFEASIPTVCFSAALAVVLLALARRKGQLLAPRWKR